MDKMAEMEKTAEQKGLDSIKYGNPGIRTDVWRKMMGLYGEAIGTFIGLNMDIAVQMLNQGVINPTQRFQKSLQKGNSIEQNEKISKVDESTDLGFKQVKIE